MEFRCDSNQIYIKHIPTVYWAKRTAVLVFSAVICLWILAVSAPDYILPNLYNLPGIAYLIALAMAVYFWVSFVGFRSLLSAVVIIIIVDRSSKYVDLVRYRIYGKRVQRFYFNQVQGFKSYKPKQLLRSGYFLQLKLSNNKRIRLWIPLGNDKLATVRFIKNLNKFMRSSQNQTEAELVLNKLAMN